MARREIISEGKDVATAIIRGLNELGRRRDQVEVTVVQEPSSGFLGIGGKSAKVKILEKKWDSEHSTPMRTGIRKKTSSAGARKGGRGGKRRPSSHRVEKSVTPKEPKENEAQKLPSLDIQNAIVPENIKKALDEAKDALAKMLEIMGVKVTNLNAWWDAKQERILLTFDCNQPALIIGKEGKTLQSIQYVITLIVSRLFSKPISVVADTQNYWRKLEDKINHDIDYAVNTLKRTKKPFRFRPMSAQMRRYIHRFLADNTEISTVSEGEGKWRKVVLKLEKTNIIPTNTNVETDINIDNKQEEKDNCDCVLTAENTTCDCVENSATPTQEGTSPKIVEQTKPAEPIKTEDSTCDCVLTAESTSCDCDAETQNIANQTTVKTEDKTTK